MSESHGDLPRNRGTVGDQLPFAASTCAFGGFLTQAHWGF